MRTTAERVERIEKETSGVHAQYGITSWELDFMRSVRSRNALSEKQEAVLAKIEDKVFGEEEE